MEVAVQCTSEAIIGAGGEENAALEGHDAGGLESDGAGAVGTQIRGANRKTCHQCRQGKTHFAAACKKVKKQNRLCPLKYCRKCLSNRYGESEDAVALDDSWNCPKCRGECNCSMCRKNNGKAPTGRLANAAKASGCSSVHELLSKGADEVAAAQKLVTTKSKRNWVVATGAGTDTNESLAEANNHNAVSYVPTKKKRKVNCTVDGRPADEKFLQGTESLCAVEDEIVLPRGTPVTNVAGADLKEEDVGPALQFYEFCRSFAEFFNLRKGEPEKILQEITEGHDLQVVASLIADLHINLFSIIQEDRGQKPLNYSRDDDQWIIDIGKYISGSTYFSKELPVDSLNQGVLGYKILSTSCRLNVLNFLCDETVCCSKLRKWISEKTKRAYERKSIARGKIPAANEKEMELKGVHSDMDKDVLVREGESIVETSNLISEVQDADEVKRAALEEGGVDRTKPIMVDKGASYWKLDGDCNNITIMRQELGENIMGKRDKWFMFTEDEENIISDHVARRSRGRYRKGTGV